MPHKKLPRNVRFFYEDVDTGLGQTWLYNTYGNRKWIYFHFMYFKHT